MRRDRIVSLCSLHNEINEFVDFDVNLNLISYDTEISFKARHLNQNIIKENKQL
jgi:hypothetical protein